MGAVPIMENTAPVDCAAQQAQLAALKAQVLSKGGVWDFPAGLGPFGSLPPCVNSGTLTLATDTTLPKWAIPAAIAALVVLVVLK